MSRKIVEKNDSKRDDELFVFGYSCKLFKDEKKAGLIDQGKHLIPWMGCESLLIDRFDVRGYLQDLRLYESTSGLYNKEIADDLTSDEMEIERLCDEERYADLKFEDEDLHEEEMKRLRAALAVDGAYHEIQFNYDTCETQEEEEINNGDNNDNESEDDPFVVPSGLMLPDGVVLPQTMKQHNLIEKTAKFISNHGVQMEILIKTKQSSNPQFDFLAFDSPLNPYYKLLVSLIKSGKYQPKSDEKESSEDDDTEDDDSDNYLHPSLLGTKSKSPSKPLVLPTLPRSVNETDSYSLLVKSLRDKIPVEPQLESSPTNENNTKEIPEAIQSQSQTPSTSQLQPQQNWSSLLPPPPPEIEIIIEKLAQYVAKNGEEFESTVRKRGEERFEFLNPGSMYHAHYIMKKLQYLEDKRKTQAAELKLKSTLESENEKQSKAPVSFSFKEKKSTMQTEEKSRKSGSDLSPPLVCKKVQHVESESKKTDMALADKLAAAARDRLSREKQLQEERKRKAALFLSMVKNKELQQEANKVDTAKNEFSDLATYGPSLPSSTKTESNVSQSSPLRDDTHVKSKNNELTKASAVLPFVISDEPLKESSRNTYSREARSSHHHHHHRHRHSHRRRYDRSRSRSKSRHSLSSRSRSRSKSPSRSKKSRTRSRSGSRSSKK